MGEAVGEPSASGSGSCTGRSRRGCGRRAGRENLIGEHTDYNDGFVMPSPCRTRSRPSPGANDGILRLHSADVDADPVELRVADLAPASDKSWTAYPSGVLWALREAGHELTGADVHLASTVPSGAGLSSSAALEVRPLAMNDLYALALRGWQLARLCQRAENVYVGAPVGIMDQTASACCEAGTPSSSTPATSPSGRSPSTSPPRGCACWSSTPGSSTPTARASTASAARAARRAPRCWASTRCDVPYADLDAALERLGDEEEVRRLVRHVVTEDERVERVVALLESATPGASAPSWSRATPAARRLPHLLPRAGPGRRHGPGLRGPRRRMTGGGFGGSAIVLVEAAAVDAVTKAVEDAFAAAGLKRPRVFEAVPRRGAAPGLTVSRAASPACTP
nr:galactokinase (EC 2.7.1.6) [Streptomyces lividans]